VALIRCLVTLAGRMHTVITVAKKTKVTTMVNGVPTIAAYCCI
jgi:hypothetical protein